MTWKIVECSDPRIVRRYFLPANRISRVSEGTENRVKKSAMVKGRRICVRGDSRIKEGEGARPVPVRAGKF